MTEAHKQKIRESILKKYQDPDYLESRARYKFSKEHKINISKSRKNMKFSKEHRQNMSKNHRDMTKENNHNWKGGISQSERANQKIYIWKRLVLQRDNFTCQICNVEGGYLHVDHIKPFSTHPELRHDVNNGRTLCRACHYYVTFKRKLPKGSKWGLGNLKQYKEC